MAVQAKMAVALAGALLLLGSASLAKAACGATGDACCNPCPPGSRTCQATATSWCKGPGAYCARSRTSAEASFSGTGVCRANAPGAGATGGPCLIVDGAVLRGGQAFFQPTYRCNEAGAFCSQTAGYKCVKQVAGCGKATGPCCADTRGDVTDRAGLAPGLVDDYTWYCAGSENKDGEAYGAPGGTTPTSYCAFQVGGRQLTTPVCTKCPAVAPEDSEAWEICPETLAPGEVPER